MKQQHSLAILLGLLLVTLAFPIFAKPSTPQNEHIVVASWDVNSNTNSTNMNVTERLNKAAWHIQKSQYPGQANQHFGRAKALLKPLISDDLTTTKDDSLTNQQLVDLLYLWARILQHQHQFSLAENTLQLGEKINAQSSINITLLKASVQLAQGEFTQAKSSCAQLLGVAQLITVAACTLEATAQLDQLSESYQQMTALLNSQPAFKDTPLDNWLLQIVTDMALHLGSPAQAQKWLELGLPDPQSLLAKPLSFVVLWADVQLALHKHQAVLNNLGSIVEKAGFKDDALLSRLAIAETNTSQSRWQLLFKQRVQLRIARKDLYHAADLARYYIYIQPSAEKALHWASINWQQAKLSDDKLLLQKAKAMQSSWRGS